ncbi:endonuclease/exonuclease/phosphatase family protein [Halopseudomonas pertucinogena]|uniref:Endonuclease n=1 Tax=Halopseudomonas pertucinogena TaxID=86175 RepID=A0ABQ2CR48_9GAMM|nr:endonuclease/exonuclease/phosphatase family protein [Halopseudomonas pertucinogena]GGJ04958.1 endonuclease [Halopseudomonas pertucinogena]
MAWIIIGLLTGLLVLLTLLPLSRHTAWWVRVWDFPRLQLATLAALLIVAALALLDLAHPASWALLGAAATCLAWQAWWILPYTRLWRKEVRWAVEDGRPLRILVANVLETNRRHELLLGLIREHQPDIFVTLESNARWQQQLDRLSDYPHRVACPLENLYGMHVYSRLPLHDAEIAWLVEQDVPSIHTLVELPGGHSVQVHFLHPAPPSPTENDESTERDVELLLVARRIENSHAPIIVTGDLNDVAWSTTTRLFRKISGLLDPRVGRGMFNTFHADHWFLRWPLDHIFHSSHFTLAGIRRLPHIGSDHFPVLVDLRYHPAELDQQGLDADAQDRALAQEKLQQEDATPGEVPAPGRQSRLSIAPGHGQHV